MSFRVPSSPLLRTVLTGLLLVLPLAGCRSGDPAAGDKDDAASSPSVAASRAKVVDGDPNTIDPAASKGPTAADLCAFLKQELPIAKKAGSALNAQGDLSVAIVNFYDQRGMKPDSSAIEEQTRQNCPDTRAAILKAAGIESFLQL